MCKRNRKLVVIALVGALGLPATALATENVTLNFRKLEWESRAVGANQTESVGAARAETVGGSRANAVKGPKATPADSNHDKWIDVLNVDWGTTKPAPGRHERSKIPPSRSITFTGLE